MSAPLSKAIVPVGRPGTVVGGNVATTSMLVSCGPHRPPSIPAYIEPSRAAAGEAIAAAAAAARNRYLRMYFIPFRRRFAACRGNLRGSFRLRQTRERRKSFESVAGAQHFQD